MLGEGLILFLGGSSKSPLRLSFWPVCEYCVAYAESCPFTVKLSAEAKLCILCCDPPGNADSCEPRCCWEDCLLKLAGRPVLPFLTRGTGESKRALLMAATAWEAVLEMFLKKVPDCPLVLLSVPELYNLLR